MPFEFVKVNYDEILKHAAERRRFGLRRGGCRHSAASFCDAASEKEYINFFGERAKKAQRRTSR